MAEVDGQRKSWPPVAETLGLKCRRCGCGHFYVVYTRRAPGGPRRAVGAGVALPFALGLVLGLTVAARAQAYAAYGKAQEEQLPQGYSFRCDAGDICTHPNECLVGQKQAGGWDRQVDEHAQSGGMHR